MQKLLAALLVLGLLSSPLPADTLSFYVLQNSANQIDFRDSSGLKIDGSGAGSLGVELGTQLYPNVDWFLGMRYNATRNFNSGGSYDSTLFYYKMRWHLLPGTGFSAYVGGLAGFDFSSQKNFPGGVHADVGSAWGVLTGMRLLESWRLEAGKLWMFPIFRNSSGAYASVYDENFVALAYEMNFDLIGMFKR